MTVDAHVNSEPLETHQLTLIYSFRKNMDKKKKKKNRSQTSECRCAGADSSERIKKTRKNNRKTAEMRVP